MASGCSHGGVDPPQSHAIRSGVRVRGNVVPIRRQPKSHTGWVVAGTLLAVAAAHVLTRDRRVHDAPVPTGSSVDTVSNLHASTFSGGTLRRRLETAQFARDSESASLAEFTKGFADRFAHHGGLQVVRNVVNAGPVTPDADVVVRVAERADGTIDVFVTNTPCGSDAVSFDDVTQGFGLAVFAASFSTTRTPPPSTPDEFEAMGAGAADRLAERLRTEFEDAWDWDRLGPSWFARGNATLDAPKWPKSAVVTLLGDVRQPLQHVHRAYRVDFLPDEDVAATLSAWQDELRGDGFVAGSTGSGATEIERLHVVRGDESIRWVTATSKPKPDPNARTFVVYHVRAFSAAERDAAVAVWLESDPALDLLQQVPVPCLIPHAVDHAAAWFERIDRRDPHEVLWLASVTRDLAEFRPRIGELLEIAIADALERLDSPGLVHELARVADDMGMEATELISDDRLRDAGWWILDPDRVESFPMHLRSLDTLLLAARDDQGRVGAAKLVLQRPEPPATRIFCTFTRIFDCTGNDFISFQSAEVDERSSAFDFQIARRKWRLRVQPQDDENDETIVCVEAAN